MMQTSSVAHQDAGIRVFNTAGDMVAEALETQTGWFVQVPYREGRGNGLPNFMIGAMTVVAIEELLMTIAKGLGEV
jgi:hypothetical protein